MHKLGVTVVLYPDTDLTAKCKEIKAYGFDCCQLVLWQTDYDTDVLAESIRTAVKASGLEISTLWAGWSGPTEWNFHSGPDTLGIVPEAYRMKRAEELIRAAHLASKIGVSRVATHAGFLPENMNDPSFYGVVAVLRYIANAYAALGMEFLFETGQETPVTLLRVIQAVGAKNLGVNLDTANLILYGKGNGADAVSVLGGYIKDTHIKDGFFPTDGCDLGREVKVGEGMANLPEVIKRLMASGYTGNFIIEREITGEQQTKDILATKTYLETLLAAYK